MQLNSKQTLFRQHPELRFSTISRRNNKKERNGTQTEINRNIGRRRIHRKRNKKLRGGRDSAHEFGEASSEGRPMAEQRVGSRRHLERSPSRGGVATVVPGVVGNLGYVKVVPPPDLNKNTEWFLYPGVWTSYILIIFIGWLLILSVFRCSAGSAWTAVNLIHFAVTYRFFHWKKGSPFGEDQGMYNKLTWWEQVDNGRQLTRNRKFLTVVPVVLYVIASHTTGYRSQFLLLNTIAVFVLLIAKFPNMHRVRIFGINSDYPT